MLSKLSKVVWGSAFLVGSLGSIVSAAHAHGLKSLPNKGYSIALSAPISLVQGETQSEWIYSNNRLSQCQLISELARARSVDASADERFLVDRAEVKLEDSGQIQLTFFFSNHSEAGQPKFSGLKCLLEKGYLLNPTGEVIDIDYTRLGTEFYKNFYLLLEGDRNKGQRTRIQNSRSSHSILHLVFLSEDRIHTEFELSAIEVILRNGADVNALSPNGYHSLVFSAYLKDIELARLLLKYHAHYGEERTLESLIRNFPDAQFAIRFSQAARSIVPFISYVLYQENRHLNEKELQVLEEILRNGADVDERGRQSLPSLMHAVIRGDLGLVQLLLRNQATPFYSSGQFRMDSEISDLRIAIELSWASRSIERLVSYIVLKEKRALSLGERQMVLELLKLGAPVDQKNPKGYTALMMAAYIQDLELVQLLRQMGASAEIKDRRNNTALDWAGGNLSILQALEK